MTQQTKTLDELRDRFEDIKAENTNGTALHEYLIIDLLAALEQAQKANEWRDISSAPKDYKQSLLLYDEGEGIQIGRWVSFSDGYCWTTDDMNVRLEPTKWQPLTPKPQSETEG